MWYLSPNFGGVFPNLQGEMPHPLPTCRMERRTWQLRGLKARLTKLEACNLSWLHSYFDWNKLRHISWEIDKSSSIKLINSPHKISHHYGKTAPIFSTFSHNTYLNSMNKHMYCNIQRTARTYQTKQCVFSLTAATVLELRYTWKYVLCLYDVQ